MTVMSSLYCSFIEFWVMLSIWIVAAITIIREHWFQFRHGAKFKITRVSKDDTKKDFCLVVGADGTIGSEVVKRLKEDGHTVYATVRRIPKIRDKNDPVTSKSEFVPLSESMNEFIQLDLEDIANVQAIGRSLGEIAFDRIIFCTGIMLEKERLIHGVEAHLWVNVISQIVLKRIIVDRIQNHSPNKSVKIVFLGSVCCGSAWWEESFSEGFLQNYLGPYQAYALSKLVLANIVEFEAKGNSSTARGLIQHVTIHPGVVPGALYRNVMYPMRDIIVNYIRWICRTSSFSASLIAFYSDDKSSFVNGEYVEDLVIKDTHRLKVSKNCRRKVISAIYSVIRLYSSCPDLPE